MVSRFAIICLLAALSFKTSAEAGTVYTTNGPWGDLKVSELFVHQDEQFFDLVPTPSAKTIWKFADLKTVDQLADFLDDALSKRNSSDRQAIQSLISIQEIRGVETRAFPTPDFILELTDEERLAIYSRLANHKQNTYHRKPVFIDSESVEEWFKGSKLDYKVIKLIEKLSYPVGDSLAFSDIPLVLGTVARKSDEFEILQALTRTRYLLLELSITAQSDINGLRDYWFPAHLKDLSSESIFVSLTRADTVPITLDITDFLPSLPRKRLGDFPTIEDGVSGAYPGGFWSSFNFFNEEPDEEEPDLDNLEDTISQRYERTEEPYRYGDMIVLRDAGDSKILHACIYIADNIAFTKNSRSILTPWVMMHLKFIKSRFSLNREVEIEGWRLKSPE
ncbi:MAG: hypothetical protein P1U89_00695 [Verrucomicrobiales bacterium]|nr:hypothetical protein [Verrucomicrobiales bacterium]